MHLKVITQGELAHFTSPLYATSAEFRDLQARLDAFEVLVATGLDEIGRKRWPTLEAVMCHFWTDSDEAPTIDYVRAQKLLSLSVNVDARTFAESSNETRANDLFYFALTVTEKAFAKYRRKGEGVLNLRDAHFRSPTINGDF